MSYIIALGKRCGLLVPLIVFGTTIGCSTSPEEARQVPASTIVIGMPEQLGPLDRPPVEFDHGEHTTVLEEEGCEACHKTDEQGAMVFLFARASDPADKDELMELYHEACTGCHSERDEADVPETCAECHVEQSQGEALRLPIGFDYSLHGRHTIAESEACDTCHHVYNEETGELEAGDGQESRCAVCHAEEEDGDTPSLADASHTQCVNCHMRRSDEGRDSGPVACVGCHDAAERENIEQLADADIPRIERGQPDIRWMQAPGTSFNLVPFYHERLEGQAETCSTCHHNGFQPCTDCHTVDGSDDGGGVTLQAAFHDSHAQQACVGCHQQEVTQQDCAGCHHVIDDVPAERTCETCHSGPLPGTAVAAMPPSPLHDVHLVGLPLPGDDFPEEITIDTLVEKYEASRFPHRQIVDRLHRTISANGLARHFHGSTEMVCAGCHHNTPVGSRPPPCASCHTEEGDPTSDVPGLRAAYHRQCVGCHEQMNIPEQGCTDCHAEIGGEGQ